MKLLQRLTFFVCAVVGMLALPSLAQAETAIVGVGFVFAPYNLPPAEQETILGQMEHAGVRVVRCSMSYDDKGVDFAQRVYAHGIKIQDYLLDSNIPSCYIVLDGSFGTLSS